MSKPIIEAVGLTYSYEDSEKAERDNRYALCGVDISISQGEYIAIVGRNGSGKSTFAKLLNLVLEPTGGELYLDGKLISGDLSDDDIIELRRRIGMVFQNPDNQIVATIVEEDVAFGPENIGIPSEEIRKRVDDALAAVNMTQFAKHEPHRLSGGQKQRVAIAGIIALMPDCMIFDESTAMLDPIGRAEVLDVIEKLVRERNITVLNITHHMSEAARADRVIVMDRGRVIADDVPSVIFRDEELLKKAGLELPQSSQLLSRLIDNGISFDKFAIDPEQCAELIIDKLNSNNSNY